MTKDILIPAGCIESHGLLPDDTDTMIAQAFCVLASKKYGIETAEALPHGFCPSTHRLPGTERSFFEEAFRNFRNTALKFIENGKRYIVFVNIHGGNDAVLKAVVQDIFVRYAYPVMYFNPYTAFADRQDKKYFKGKDNNYKEISLLQASRALLGLDAIKGPDKNQAQKRDPLLERLKRRAVVGFSYTETPQHVAWRKDVDETAGRKYMAEAAGLFGRVFKDFKIYADRMILSKNHVNIRNGRNIHLVSPRINKMNIPSVS